MSDNNYLHYLYEKDTAKNFFGKNYFSNRELGFQVIEHGTILPHKDVYVDGKWTWGKGGIVDGAGNYIDNSFVHSGFGGKPYPLPKSIQKSNETVIYLGLFYPVWGHAITDNVRRVWFLTSEIFRNEFKNCPIVYVPWEIPAEPADTNFMRFLEILGVDVERLRKIDTPTRFDKIIMPADSFNCFVFGFTKEYRKLIERVRNFALKNRTPTSVKKIYYFHGLRQIGEERLAEYFKSKGYEIIRPEKLTLDEQLNILINADNFAAPLGSTSHNTVFMRDDTEAIFIRRFINFNKYQAALNQIHPMIARYIDSSLSLFGGPYRNYCYIVSKQLRKFFGDKCDTYAEEDFKN